MKKLIILLIGIFTLNSCSTQQVAAELETKKINPIYELPFTNVELSKGITIDNISDRFIIEKGDLIGAVVSLDTKGKPIILTSQARLYKQKSHNNGAILLSAEINGGGIIEFPGTGGWLLVDADYTNNLGYPEGVTLSQEDDNETYCIPFSITNNGNYKPELNLDKNGNFIKTEAGYQYTDSCSNEIKYLNNPFMEIDKGYIEVLLSDSRLKKKGSELKLPMKYRRN